MQKVDATDRKMIAISFIAARLIVVSLAGLGFGIGVAAILVLGQDAMQK